MENIFGTLGMFIIDEFEYRDSDGNPQVDRSKLPQIGGGGTYAAIGARMFLQPQQIKMIVDHGNDLPKEFFEKLLSFGQDMWLFRKQQDGQTTRALNKYVGQQRRFEYLTPRTRLTLKDLTMFHPNLSPASYLHFICSPTRAIEIITEIKGIIGWNPVTIFEPVPDRCVPEELPALKKVLSQISVLSPNAEEALSLLGNSQINPTRASIELAAQEFLRYGIGKDGKGSIIIRSGGLGACVAKHGEPLRWVNAYWEPQNGENHNKIIDVTGAGNAFLGGLSAGLCHTQDIFEATFYASVAASFVVEQFGLPDFQVTDGLWNGEDPTRRLQEFRARHAYS